MGNLAVRDSCCSVQSADPDTSLKGPLAADRLSLRSIVWSGCFGSQRASGEYTESRVAGIVRGLTAWLRCSDGENEMLTFLEGRAKWNIQLFFTACLAILERQ